jgi:hypothetical protein
LIRFFDSSTGQLFDVWGNLQCGDVKLLLDSLELRGLFLSIMVNSMDEVENLRLPLVM